MNFLEVRVQQGDFEASEEFARLRGADPGIGALASFIGLVRDVNDGSSVADLHLEHYPGMTERSIEAIAREAGERWRLRGALVVHRVGELRPLDQIVLVAVSSAHRGDAFEACAFIMDYLKTRAPFWKKETTPDGQRWVAARASDSAAAGRWQHS